jgi:hypothetical protein
MLVGADAVVDAFMMYVAKVRTNTHEGMGKAMAAAESQSKQSAPWKDHTGNARNSIFGQSEVKGTDVTGYHGIGVSYGLYLELSNQGRYRVLLPTRDWLRPRLFGFLYGI